jgi:hypothetical protein
MQSETVVSTLKMRADASRQSLAMRVPTKDEMVFHPVHFPYTVRYQSPRSSCSCDARAEEIYLVMAAVAESLLVFSSTRILLSNH